ncbi:MAG: UpxY family transcription antiterminator [Chitinophagaceae bacterium]|nr:MAG: UpxY family transcription antiterminator [Chitinophagaceae bacterium]
MQTTKRWFAVYTRPRWEKKTAALFSRKGIENYCPTLRQLKQWADRKKTVYEPLFTSYVFLHIDESEFVPVLQTSGVLHFVYWLGKPAVIRDDEIMAIRRFLGEYINITVERSIVNVDDNVRIISGPLQQLEGQIREVRHNSVKVYLPSLGYTLIAEIEKSNVEVIHGIRKQTKAS